MRIAVDAMGGDFAPGEVVLGALLAARDSTDCEFVLVGDEAAIQQHLPGGKLPAGMTIQHASECIKMDESPSRAVRAKRDSSLVVAARMLHNHEVDALFTAGNTGAAVAAGLTVVGRVPGIDRAYIALLLPTPTGHSVLLDAGATVDCKPRHFAEMALMGSLYARTRLNCTNPKVALLNVGSEHAKGSRMAKKAFDLLQQMDLDFVGNTEGDRLFKGDVDVIVCDGFVGNVALKVAESGIKVALDLLASEIKAGWWDRLAGLMLRRSAFKRVRAKLDYSAYGAALLLGIAGTYTIGHGKSSAQAVAQALRVTHESARAGVVDSIAKAVPEQISRLVEKITDS